MSMLSLTQELPPRFGRSDAVLGVVLAAWGASAAAVSTGGVLSAGGPAATWLFPLLIFGPVGLFALGLAIAPGLRDWALELDLRLLIGIHATRTIGLSFVFLYVCGLLPGGFAFPAGFGDAIAAIGAVWLSFSLARGAPVDDAAIARWNWFGIADFLVAVGTGLLFQSAFLGGVVNTDAMTTFPLALIPLFAVPLLAISHLIIALQLRVGVR
jgi:drug/metabolite transporter superfamily protein YnfA